MKLFGRQLSTPELIKDIAVLALFLACTIYSFVSFGFQCVIFLFLILSVFAIIPIDMKKKEYQDLYFGGLAAFCTFYFPQMIISYGCPPLTRLVGHSLLHFICSVSGSETMMHSLCIAAILYMFLRLIRVNPKAAAIAVPVPFMLLGIADVFVTMARGYELIAVDLVNVATATTVASNYSYNITHMLLFAVVPYALYVLAILNLPKVKEVKKPENPNHPVDHKKRARIKDLKICAGAFAVLLLLFIPTYMFYNISHIIETYTYGPSYANTFVLNFFYSTKLFQPTKPAEYSRDYIDANAVTSGDGYDYVNWVDDDVNIVVIMNEAYANMEIYEDRFASFEDPAPYYRALRDDPNCISGYYLASIFGSNTANSEFEFLTGLSMGYVNQGLVAYSTAITRPIISLPRYLKTQGYHSFAMHPNLSDNWRRNLVYPYMDFDDMFFLKEMDLSKDDMMRSYTDDISAYRNLIEQIEASHNNGEDRVFAFLITMQNHGGFEDCYDYDNFTPSEYVTAPDSGAAFSLDQMNGYLSLIHESDKALEYLVEYFKAQDEKYILFFFGDHQPSVAGVREMAAYPQQSYEVPYFMWANYDIPEEIRSDISSRYLFAEDTLANTTMNYCALDVMEYAGLPLSPYYKTLLEIRKEIPMINAQWYYTRTMTTCDLIPSGTQPVDAMRLYSYIEYDALYDKKNAGLTDF